MIQHTGEPVNEITRQARCQDHSETKEREITHDSYFKS